MRREKTRVDHLDALPTFEGAGASDLEHLGIGAASLNEVFTALTSDGSDGAAPSAP